MKKLLTTVVLSATCLFAPLSQAATIKKPKAVVELFTSQGCSSCPPADRLLGEFAASDNVLAIGWHVDYWDYLGWKDSFATRENTERQYKYATTLNETQVYTPQAIVNGRVHVVGSREERVKQAIAKLDANQQGMIVPIDVSVDSERIRFSVAGAPTVKDATVYILSMNRDVTVKIDRGENGGKTLKYHNVIRELRPVGMVKAGGISMEYPLSELKRDGYDCHAIIVQQSDGNGNPSAILGAVYLEDL